MTEPGNGGRGGGMASIPRLSIFRLLKRIGGKLSRKAVEAPVTVKEGEYSGFRLFYSDGTSLLAMIQKDRKIYEPEVTDCIVGSLSGKPAPVFMDVGANIGLISLNVLAALPSAKIFAFEPGPHQRLLFAQTIEANGLQGRITLEGRALARQSGRMAFSVHRHQDASGDGFLDTGRAGRARSIQVPAVALDDWWIERQRPNIDTIKIDTEGAELWILQGAKQLLVACRPDVVLEICPINLVPYPYGAVDILNYLKQIDYRLSTLFGETVAQDNFSDCLSRYESFLAQPADRQG